MKKALALAAITATSSLPTSTTADMIPPDPLSPLLTDAFNDGALNAIWFPGLLPNLTTYPAQSKNTNGTDGGLPDSCTRCGPEGCYCSIANATNADTPLGICESCRDTMDGLVCYCSEYELSGAPRCGVKSLIDLQPCRLNDPSAKQTLVIENADEGQACGNGGVNVGWYYATVMLITAILATILSLGVMVLTEQRKRRRAAMG